MSKSATKNFFDIFPMANERLTVSNINGLECDLRRLPADASQEIIISKITCSDKGDGPHRALITAFQSTRNYLYRKYEQVPPDYIAKLDDEVRDGYNTLAADNLGYTATISAFLGHPPTPGYITFLFDNREPEKFTIWTMITIGVDHEKLLEAIHQVGGVADGKFIHAAAKLKQ